MANLSEIFYALTAACSDAGGQTAWAEKNGISPTYVSLVLNAKTEPGPKILAALGYRKQISYERLNA